MIAMTTTIALSSLVHLCPRLRRVEGRGWGASHSVDKEEKQSGWPSHIVIVALLTLPPPSDGDVINPARMIAIVPNNTFVGGKEEGAAMAVVESNVTTMTMMRLV